MSRRTTAALTLLCQLCLIAAASAFHPQGGRKLQADQNFSGRKLLAISVSGTPSFTLSAFGGGNGQSSDGNCFLQGYPGSRADSTVAGPLTVSVYPGDKTTINFSRGSEAYIANYNYSGNVGLLAVTQNSTYGLSSVTFSPQAAGNSANIFSGLISGTNPITQPTCLVNISFISVARPTPPPTPTQTPTPTTGPAGTCSGAVPCYCQNGYCFNNGATLSQTCNPPAGQTCTPTTVNPSAIGVQYAFGYGSSVSVCKCTATAGK